MYWKSFALSSRVMPSGLNGGEAQQAFGIICFAKRCIHLLAQALLCCSVAAAAHAPTHACHSRHCALTA
eukprot:scaffold256671_cov18-Tisochrysis_lutea.AAC.1